MNRNVLIVLVFACALIAGSLSRRLSIEPLHDGANDERPGDGGVGEHLREASALLRGDELAPGTSFSK